MAQIIQIPVSFEFRAAKVQWTKVSGRVMGWRRDKETKKPEYLSVEIGTPGSAMSISISPMKLPATLIKQSLATLGKSKADEAVRQICSDFEMQFFNHAVKPIIGDADVKKYAKPADAWQMRDDFLRLRPDGRSCGAFLERWGRWNSLRSYTDEQEIFDLQEAVRNALISSPDKWFASHYAFPTIKGSGCSEFPYFTMLTDACQLAICTATTFDLLRQLEFKTCARGDCGVPFPLRSNHKRTYCTQYCAHLESVRRSRKNGTAKQGKGA